MLGLKITQTDGTSEIVGDTNVIALLFAAPAFNTSTLKPLRITSAHYAHLVATTLTYVNATTTLYDGTNVLYEYGELTEAGSFRVIAANR